MLIDSLSREAELEEVTDAVLLSRSDDCNALAAVELRGDLGYGHVYRIAPDHDQPDLLPPATEIDILGDSDLTLAALSQRVARGEQVTRTTVDGSATAERHQNGTVLFVVDPHGSLRAATAHDGAAPHTGDVAIVLGTPSGGPGDPRAGSRDGVRRA
jgi:hypothetical protein